MFIIVVIFEHHSSVSVSVDSSMGCIIHAMPHFLVIREHGNLVLQISFGSDILLNSRVLQCWCCNAVLL